MKRPLWGMLLLLLIASSALVTSSHETTPPSAKSGDSPANNDKLGLVASVDDNAAKEVVEKTSVVEHAITAAELEELKNKIGVSEADRSRNQLVDGYGTGLCAPTEDEWTKIAASLYLIDNLTYQAGDSAPAAVDQSAKPWFPPIGNQGAQGSCVAWSVGYYVKTFQEAKEHAWDLSGASWLSGQPTLSYQNEIISPAFIYNLVNGGVDTGSSYYDAIQLICFVGASSWEKMPYNASIYTAWPSEEAWTEAALYRGNSSGYQYMSVDTDAGLTNLKNWIASDHLATISIDANKYSGLTSADVWTLDNYANPSENHANTVVGYDDDMSYTENGTVRHGAFKVANSWGVGGWENVPDGFYWISYETMKQRVRECMFYYDRLDYEPELLATFAVSHQKRSECDIEIGLGSADSPIATKSFSQYVNGGSVPFPPNNIVLDITEFKSYVPTVYGEQFFLRLRDGGTSTTGVVSKFAVEREDSKDAPIQTINQKYVYLNLTLPLFGQITINSRTRPSTPNQIVAAGDNVNLFFSDGTWSSGEFRLLLSKDNLSQVSTGDTAYTPMFNLVDLNASAVTVYTSTNGNWQVGYNWVNGTMPTNIAGGKYFFKASDSFNSVIVSVDSITVIGTLTVTPTSGPASAELTISGYAFSANSSANLTYLNPVTSTWISIINNTLTDAAGHFTYTMAAPDLLRNHPAGDNAALFDSIIFRAQDNNDSSYYNGTTPFNEFRRGLAQVGTAVATGLYGNNTDLTSTVRALIGQSISVAGKWFVPGNVIFLLDETYLGTAVADGTGNFNKILTLPTTSVGLHTIRIADVNTDFLVRITVLPAIVTSDNYDGLWHTADFTITLTPSDNGNGIATTYYKINNELIKNVNANGQPRITTDGSNNILEYWSVDGAGNEEYPHRVLTQIKLDKTAPTGSIQINNGASYVRSNSVTLTLVAADPTSGVLQVRFSNDGVWDTESWEASVITKNWVLTSGEGLKTVYYQIKDHAGLISSFTSSTTLDETSPVVSVNGSQTVKSGSSVTFDASNGIDNVGIVGYKWDFGDGTNGTGKTTTHTYTSSGTYTVKLTAKDAAGNTATSSTIIAVQPNTIPEFPLAFWLPLFLTITFISSLMYKRKSRRLTPK